MARSGHISCWGGDAAKLGVMPPAYIPSVRARRLARSLREAREAAGYRVTAAAASLGWSQPKLSHIEKGRTKPTVGDVERMLDLYGVTTPDRDALVALAAEADRRGWWTDYLDVLHGPYVVLEDAAAHILDWAPQVVPGLLQTPEYAREVMMLAHGHDSNGVERRVRARVQRQMLLTRPHPPRFHVILDESVLMRPIGGRQVMRDQLYRLLSDADRGNVTVQILPLTAGGHPGLDGTFIVLRFAEPDDPDVAYVEGVHGAVYLESAQAVAQCSVRFEGLRAQALSPEESAEVIRSAAKQF
jgi:transcriptional regulator with XRE-family HTH domain